MAIAIDQATRLLGINTPLGENVLILQSFSGSEGISELFTYECEMLSAEEGIAPADIVGANVTIVLHLGGGEERYFNGYVTQFVGGAMHARDLRRYRAEIVPWFWFLTRSTDCRIFQFKTVPQIIEEVFGDFEYSDFELDLQGNHPEREYCVQYRESAFNFLSRLMEEEGMFYWFRQEEDSHTLVIADHIGAYVDCPENEIEYSQGSREADHISQWEHLYEFRSGKYAQTDYNFETPRTDLATNTKTLIDLPAVDKFELYDYPGDYGIRGDGEELTRIRMEEEEVPHDVVRCVSGCGSLHTMGKFTVTRHECESEEDKTYAITDIQHSAIDHTQVPEGGETFYQNTFSCIPDARIFRPGRVTPKPKIRGPQTAVVVGPSGEEIYTDDDGYGQVKVQFHWDRYGTRDENSSCWMRVSQVHAGKGFGGIDIPRIGEEVLVDHLEGDPDRPIITGRVYNADNMPPNGLPAAKVVSGLKSNTTPGGGGSNSIMMDDTKNKEGLNIHAQYNMDTKVENDRSATVVSGNDTTTVSAGTRTVTVKGNTSLTVQAGDRVVNVTGSYKGDTTDQINLQAPNKITLTCGGSSIEMVPGKITITAGGGASMTLDGNALTKSSAGSEVLLDGNANMKSSAGSHVLCDANALMESTAGDKVLLDGKATMSSRAEAKVEAPTSIVTGGVSTTKSDAGGVAVTGPKISLNG